MTRSKILAAAAGAAALLAIPQAALANDGAPRQHLVNTSDLNLTTIEGQAKLKTRLARAARLVCDSGSNTLRAQLAERACIARANHASEIQMAKAIDNARLGG